MSGFDYTQEEFARCAGNSLVCSTVFEVSPDHEGLIRAAVLVAVIERGDGGHILLTRRPQSMADHGGQIAFPGGKIEAQDAHPADAALREAYEETGLGSGFVNVLGAMEPCNTSTGFLVTPVIATVAAGFSLKPDPREVDEIFEVPLAFLMNGANHQTHSGVYRGQRIKFPVICYGDYYIWGATARMLIQLYNKVYVS